MQMVSQCCQEPLHQRPGWQSADAGSFVDAGHGGGVVHGVGPFLRRHGLSRTQPHRHGPARHEQQPTQRHQGPVGTVMGQVAPEAADGVQSVMILIEKHFPLASVPQGDVIQHDGVVFPAQSAGGEQGRVGHQQDPSAPILEQQSAGSSLYPPER